jgi:hypothetical protein
MVSWFALIDSAKTPAEVLGVARDFMATWTPEELGRLPESCRPGKLRDADDIESLHACLVEEYRRSRATGPALKSLQELTSFMVRASIRLAEITDPKGSGGSGGSPSGPSKSASSPEN